MKKRLFIFALAAVISMSVVSLVGCGKNEVNHANAAVSASATPSEAKKTEESTVNTTAPAQTQTTTSVAADTKTENKSADNKSVTKGTEATAPANNNSKTENNSKTSGSSQSQSSNKSAQSGSQTNGQTNSQTNNQSSKSTNKNTSNSTNTNNGSSSKSSSADPHAGKTWHEAVYKTVNHPAVTGERKVIDQPAYSYEEPVYETKLIAKCKDCGMDISQLGSQEARDAHAEAHMDEGGDGGWYTATEQVQVGTRTVEVPEQSHMETYIVKEAWTEKVLVKEAGWY